MRIEKILLNNFRIYSGLTEINFNHSEGQNVTLIAGKNGFGKTSFLTSMIWGLYGSLMAQVENKYKRDIRSAGGYELYRNDLLNHNILNKLDSQEIDAALVFVELHLVDVLIPSIPCKKLVIRRSFDYKKNKEELKIFIDGQENELTKEVGYDVFINDFILPREIAKFFFFDAEKIVTLAEAKSKSELRSLSKAYSEVLGIKKYEDLKLNLRTLLNKIKRAGVSEKDESKIAELEARKDEISGLIQHNETQISNLIAEISNYRTKIDQNQEQLIREGNEMTLDKLKELKTKRDNLKKAHLDIKGELKTLIDLIPFALAKNQFEKLIKQVKLELDIKNASIDKNVLEEELFHLEKEFNSGISQITQDSSLAEELKVYFKKLSSSRVSRINDANTNGKIILDYDEETYRRILATYDFLTNSFRIQFDNLVKKEKEVRQELNRTIKKIKQGEVRKGNPLAQKLRAEKEDWKKKIAELDSKKLELNEENGALKHQEASNNKVLSELLKKTSILSTDKKKYEVTTELLEKLENLTLKIKEEKKYSLQKSILLGLKKLMHKDDFIKDIKVRIDNDVMDIDLINKSGKVIDKDGLSKGEQQLYATALLKALVDESKINFPIFIDSPLQKFDKEHSRNVIEQFYPTISDQVVLFPLLEKELSKTEYEQLKPNLTGVYLINNNELGSSIEECKITDLFNKFNQQHVLAH
ncbi:DNA sulfur modification protein DndD [Salegentibacter maritimus]|uniref:DNA sulfur modification protein DndD n=1 Tax=Salegentibacter maritimus TaxID=2794347 RepID=UPI0018E44134|nr:DNA sulfur modification protein DndD [Salegentibacter maritimus]MBI6115995.1 DNA sulfur modification protein DndD [Salegentibacter maritimus]